MGVKKQLEDSLQGSYKMQVFELHCAVLLLLCGILNLIKNVWDPFITPPLWTDGTVHYLNAI